MNVWRSSKGRDYTISMPFANYFGLEYWTWNDSKPRSYWYSEPLVNLMERGKWRRVQSIHLEPVDQLP